MEERLEKYNLKRDFNKTKEPYGKKAVSRGKLRFVVQHHIARKDHYDLRLEWDGVLKSWAVPKGPSFLVKDKRLAVHVEDHPLSYRTFEGVIPKNQYGGGTVMLWDIGYWEPLEDFNGNFDGKAFKFLLKGKRLQGQWTLIPFKEKNWLLIKEKDFFENYLDISFCVTSVKTNRTMEEITNGNKKTVVDNENCFIESVKITNPKKLIFRHPNVTKYELVNYYKEVAPFLFPYLYKRLISTVRCPSGANGTCFYKKHFEKNNLGLKKVLLSRHKEEEYFYVQNLTGLLYEVQMNGYEFHIWGSRMPSLSHPDMMVFDLDPDEHVSLKRLRQGVRDLKSILDEFSLVGFLKTSGGKGYHVVVPFRSIKNWDEFRDVAANIAKLMESRWPDRYVSTMSKEARKNKIFIDWMRNIKGSTSVAPYSVRIRKKATVSMPISWSELDKIKPGDITIKEALARLKRKNPWEDFFEIDQ